MEANISTGKKSKIANEKKTKFNSKLFIEVGMLVIGLIYLIPFFAVILNSFKTADEARTVNLSLPSDWTLSNYMTVLSDGSVITGFFNSLLISGGSLLLVVTTASFAAFIISRRSDTKLSNFLYVYFIAGLIVPPAIVPTIKTLEILSLLNTRIGIILFYTAMYIPFAILLFTGFIKSIPRELDESALIDGCKTTSMFYRIIFPILQPVIITCAIFVFMFVWNDFQWPFFILSKSELWTLPLTVFSYVSKYNQQYNLIFADLVLVMLPILIFYLVAQRHVIDGMTAGAVKG
ncbi:carbohydrate ABC transporter permease [Niallia sp. JL1B1071]|uniref:carbohydrate ABC transporter permease n=1 Tax=Niallia tiangongensis TaxID=3237105 RepID=UPI0037DC7AD8